MALLRLLNNVGSRKLNEILEIIDSWARPSWVLGQGYFGPFNLVNVIKPFLLNKVQISEEKYIETLS